MGLDTSHDCWHAPYSHFNEWRQKIAVAAGYEIEDITIPGGPGGKAFTLKHIKVPDVTRENVQGEWHETPADPLLILFAHSDCDGVIRAKDARPIADALMAMRLDHCDLWVLTATDRFVAGLLRAATLGEDVDFH